MPDITSPIAAAVAETYVVSSAQAQEFPSASHIITTGPFDVLVMQDGRHIPLDVSLCGCCDAVLVDGFCKECH